METRLEYRPSFPDGYRPGVGVVGCGGIVKLAHLAAYTAYGVDVVGVYDTSSAATEEIRERHPVVGRVFGRSTSSSPTLASRSSTSRLTRPSGPR